jgi:hypothetical protein
MNYGQHLLDMWLGDLKWEIEHITDQQFSSDRLIVELAMEKIRYRKINTVLLCYERLGDTLSMSARNVLDLIPDDIYGDDLDAALDVWDHRWAGEVT